MGIFSKWFRQRDVAAAVERILDDKLTESLGAIRSVDALTEERRSLIEQLTELRARKDRLEQTLEVEREGFERERRDVEHKLGLEQMRQEREAEWAQDEIASLKERLEDEKRVAIKEARLEAKLEAMAEAREQMSDVQDRQERMIERLVGALPTAKMFGGARSVDVVDVDR